MINTTKACRWHFLRSLHLEFDRNLTSLERRNKELLEGYVEGKKRHEASKRGKVVKVFRLCHRVVLSVKDYSRHCQVGSEMEAKLQRNFGFDLQASTVRHARVHGCAVG